MRPFSSLPYSLHISMNLILVSKVFVKSSEGQKRLKMITLSRGLLKELECPVCINFLTPPITMCSNGHNIGACCTPHLKECPVCRNNLRPVRNLLMESIIGAMKSACVNYSIGCSVTLSLKMIKEHEALCPLGEHQCPMNKFPGVNCRWRGSMAEFQRHASSASSGHIRITKSSFVSSANCTRERVIFAFGEIFLYYKQKQEDKWYFVIMLVGTRAQAAKFKCVLTFKSPSGIDNIIYTHSVRSFAEDFQSIMNGYNCPQLEEGMMKKFVENGCLNLNIEISKA